MLVISKGLFQTQLKDCCRILKQLKLLDECSVASPPYSDIGASFFRKMTYSQTWLWCCQNNHYDFILIDGGLFQFKYTYSTHLELSYSYYEAPLLPLLTFEEFVLENELQNEDDEYEVLRLYEFYSADPPKKECITPVRYDYAPKEYKSGRHPASHLHFGHSNNIRVGTKKILRPLSFVFFIIRQYYPDYWSIFLEFDKCEILCRNVRDCLADISREHWNIRDTFEMSLI